MLTSKISVYRNNRPVKNVKVTLEFTGLSNLGFTKVFYTDANGVAFVEHSSNGTANIYLDENLKGSFQAPGKELFYL